jgi:RimJ/RimL family protein N-acetyltransferase
MTGPALPTLETARLRLRPFSAADAPDVQRLAGAREIAATTLTVPHPYEEGFAEQWIATHGPSFTEGKSLTLAVTENGSGALIGAVGLALTPRDQRAELGFWIGVPYWGRGYATEAARAMVQYGIRVLGLHRIMARHMAHNLASGRVMQKIGMTREGVLREHAYKWGRYEDLVVYALLA